MLPISSTVPRRNPPIVTWLLIIANGLIFLFELMMPPSELGRFIRSLGIVPARFTHPEWALRIGFPIDDY